MTEKYIMSEHYIPDGILHDQDLYNVSYSDNVLTLSFETHYYPQNFTDTTFAEKYKDFTKCHIKCKIEERKWCDVFLETSMKKNKYKGIGLSFEEFIEIANKEIKRRKDKGYYSWAYLDTSVCPNVRSININLSIWLKYKGTVYDSCTLSFFTNEIEFIWD